MLAKYKNITASGAVKSTGGSLHGIVVNSHTSGTVKLYDGTDTSGTVILNTFTFPTGSGVYMLPPGITFGTGLYVTVGGTLDCTFIYA